MKKFLYIAVIGITVWSCGGGGGDTPTPTPTPTITPTQTSTPTPTPPSYYAYIFPEPQDSNSALNLGQYMSDSGATNFFGFSNSGVPPINDYASDLIIYAKYSGFTTAGFGNVEPQFKSFTNKPIIMKDYYERKNKISKIDDKLFSIVHPKIKKTKFM